MLFSRPWRISMVRGLSRKISAYLDLGLGLSSLTCTELPVCWDHSNQLRAGIWGSYFPMLFPFLQGPNCGVRNTKGRPNAHQHLDTFQIDVCYGMMGPLDLMHLSRETPTPGENGALDTLKEQMKKMPHILGRVSSQNPYQGFHELSQLQVKLQLPTVLAEPHSLWNIRCCNPSTWKVKPFETLETTWSETIKITIRTTSPSSAGVGGFPWQVHKCRGPCSVAGHIPTVPSPGLDLGFE